MIITWAVPTKRNANDEVVVECKTTDIIEDGKARMRWTVNEKEVSEAAALAVLIQQPETITKR